MSDEKGHYACVCTHSWSAHFHFDKGQMCTLCNCTNYREKFHEDNTEDKPSGEVVCQEGGNYGLCKTHPTCEMVQNKIKGLENQVKDLQSVIARQNMELENFTRGD